MLDVAHQAEEMLGSIDILVCCAGVMYFTLMKNLHFDEWEKTVDVNCKVRRQVMFASRFLLKINFTYYFQCSAYSQIPND